MSTRKSAGRRILLVLSLIIIIVAVICCFRFRTEIKTLQMIASGGQSDTIGSEDDIRRRLEETLGVTVPICTDDVSDASGSASAENGTVADGGETAVNPDSSDPASGADSASQTGAASGNTGSQTSAEGSNSNGSGSQSAEQSGNTKQQIIQKYVNQLSQIQGSFSGELNGMKSRAIAQYAALDSSQQTTSAKMAIVQGMYGELTSMQSRCDAQVQSLLGNMKSELAAAGEDTSSVQELQSYYEDMKASVIASCVAELTS